MIDADGRRTARTHERYLERLPREKIGSEIEEMRAYAAGGDEGSIDVFVKSPVATLGFLWSASCSIVSLDTNASCAA